MKRLALVFVLLLVLVLAVVLTTRFIVGSGSSTTVFKYGDFSKYTAGSGSVAASKVRSIELDWVSGSIQIIEDNVPDVRFEEICSSKLDSSNCMYWYLDGSTLRIKWCRSGISGTTLKSSKDLVIVVPKGTALDNLEANCTSAAIDVQTNASDLKINSVSGSIVVFGSYGDSVRVNNVSGSVYLDYAHCPEKVTFDTVSGNATLAIPASSGFTATLKSLSGKLFCDIPATVSSGTYIAGDGKSVIKGESVSGNVTIKAK